MGVCPQDNLLWEDLTGDEHLQFYGRLRGLPERKKKGRSHLKQHINYWLKRCNLATRSTKVKSAKAYSGGMKRRLSVACSFVGNPRLVYLDEPSTGLDPESRRQLWYAIRAAKRDKSLILTTHALEEAGCRLRSDRHYDFWRCACSARPLSCASDLIRAIPS